MAWIGGIVGGLVGFGIGLLITEAIIGNSATGAGFDWQFWTDIVVTIVGVLVGISVARRLTGASE
jgi:ABC-type antimicrobial peptide transport system permease subunit